MASAAHHQQFGVLCTLAVGAVNDCPEEERLPTLGAMFVAGLAGLRAPDILEPAIHSHHRKFFHSFLVLGGLAWATQRLWVWKPETLEMRLVRAAAIGALVGYCSHLLLDATTPRGLPLIS